MKKKDEDIWIDRCFVLDSGSHTPADLDSAKRVFCGKIAMCDALVVE